MCNKIRWILRVYGILSKYSTNLLIDPIINDFILTNYICCFWTYTDLKPYCGINPKGTDRQTVLEMVNLLNYRWIKEGFLVNRPDLSNTV